MVEPWRPLESTSTFSLSSLLVVVKHVCAHAGGQAAAAPSLCSKLVAGHFQEMLGGDDLRSLLKLQRVSDESLISLIESSGRPKPAPPPPPVAPTLVLLQVSFSCCCPSDDLRD